ncbi:MAG: glycosyltransferase, partial [Candidatus Hodarchaeota archaeon]
LHFWSILMKKKVLIIITQLKVGGGAQRVATDLSLLLSEKYDISFITFEDFNNKYAYKGEYYSLLENYSNIPKILKYLIRFFKIFKKIKQISPDIILSFLDLPSVIIIITKLMFHIKIPLIVSNHVNPKMQYKNKMRYLNFLIKILYPLKIVDAITTISNGVKKILLNDYYIKGTKVKVIYNGIFIKKIHELGKEMVEDNQDIFYNKNLIKFITIGRLEEVKGHKYLIKAFSKVKKEIKNSKLLIIGEGSLRVELKNLIQKLDLLNDVLMLGLKRNPFSYIAKCDIFVLSSIYEGLPTVLIEALACGLPIISTDCIAGPKEILENGRYGLLARVRDVEDLAKKMVFLARNKNLQKKFSNFSTKRAEIFNIKKVKQEWINLIESFF